MVLPVVTTLAEARDAIRDLAEENEKLSHELAWFRRQMFGSKTEHYIPQDDTPSLFPEEESPAQPEESPLTTVSEHERKVRQANALSEIPADLPREERIIDVPEEQRLGMTLIGYEESERIAYRTGLYVIHFKRAKYADSSDALRGVVTAPAPGDVFDSVSGRTRYDVSFVAKVVADKVENAIPLERQARMFGNERLPVAPSTLEDLYKRTADALLPLYERMVDRIMQCDILHADETFIKLMVKGAKKCKQAYLWCRLTGIGPPMIAFHFSPSRSRDVAESLLGDYSGTIIRDSYAAYFQERKNARRQSQKLVQDFFAQCRVLKESERPSSPVAQAISYALNIEAELKKFLKDARLNIDNNPAERLNRGIAIIRKNCLFAGSEAGGQRLAILYSFAATCKANGICFRKWLEDVLPRLTTTPAGQIDSLIPGMMQSSQ